MIDITTRDFAVHQAHCNSGEYEGTCKYGLDEQCPAMQGPGQRFSPFSEPGSRWRHGWLRSLGTVATDYEVVRYPDEIPFVLLRSEWLALPSRHPQPESRHHDC